MKTLKPISVGNPFKVKYPDCTMTGMTDHRLYRCLGPTTVKLLQPSAAQMNGDSAFRDGSWKENAVSEVEEAWFTQRGYKVV